MAGHREQTAKNNAGLQDDHDPSDIGRRTANKPKQQQSQMDKTVQSSLKPRISATKSKKWKEILPLGSYQQITLKSSSATHG